MFAAKNEFLKGGHNQSRLPLILGSRVGRPNDWSGMTLHWILSHCGGDLGYHRLGGLCF